MGYRTQMVSELLSVREAEDSLRARTGAYGCELSPSDFTLTSGVGPLQITLTADGWTASVAHRGLPTITCAAYVGSTPLGPAVQEGEPRCRGRIPIDRRQLMVGLGMIAAGALLAWFISYRST